MIYVASAFSSKDPNVQRVRHSQVKMATTALLKARYVAFSPIVYGMRFSKQIGTSAADWKFFNDYMLLTATRALFLGEPEELAASLGVQYELKMCEKNFIPLSTYTYPEFYAALRAGNTVF